MRGRWKGDGQLWWLAYSPENSVEQDRMYRVDEKLFTRSWYLNTLLLSSLFVQRSSLICSMVRERQLR